MALRAHSSSRGAAGRRTSDSSTAELPLFDGHTYWQHIERVFCFLVLSQKEIASMDADEVSAVEYEPEGSTRQPPVWSQRIGSVTVSIWERRTHNNDRCWFEFSLVRSFKTDNGWRNTYSFRAEDAGDLQLCCLTALKWIRSEGKSRSVAFAQQTGKIGTDEDIPY
jgi:hypothetical protein